MLTEIFCAFPTAKAARQALTAVRIVYRVRFAGAVVCKVPGRDVYHVHAPLGGTGFSAAELAIAMEARKGATGKPHALVSFGILGGKQVQDASMPIEAAATMAAALAFMYGLSGGREWFTVGTKRTRASSEDHTHFVSVTWASGMAPAPATRTVL